MTPDPSAWRSWAAYDHVESLTASDIGWEWLRRNDAYDADYKALAHQNADERMLTERVQRKWGLRFPH